jgi:hypothetical protein
MLDALTHCVVILWPDETTSHLTKLQMQQQVIGYT